VLAELDVDADTVLVIRGGELVTRHEHVGEDDDLEIRPVISGGGA
jgi:sulfur carrier protein ThiS